MPRNAEGTIFASCLTYIKEFTHALDSIEKTMSGFSTFGTKIDYANDEEEDDGEMVLAKPG
jgi:hypothetical protein